MHAPAARRAWPPGTAPATRAIEQQRRRSQRADWAARALVSACARNGTTRSRYRTPEGQAVSQARQPRQRSTYGSASSIVSVAFERLLHQHDAAARRVHLLAEHAVGRAGGQAEAAVHACGHRARHGVAVRPELVELESDAALNLSVPRDRARAARAPRIRCCGSSTPRTRPRAVGSTRRSTSRHRPTYHGQSDASASHPARSAASHRQRAAHATTCRRTANRAGTSSRATVAHGTFTSAAPAAPSEIRAASAQNRAPSSPSSDSRRHRHGSLRAFSARAKRVGASRDSDPQRAALVEIDRLEIERGRARLRAHVPTAVGDAVALARERSCALRAAGRP